MLLITKVIALQVTSGLCEEKCAEHGMKRISRWIFERKVHWNPWTINSGKIGGNFEENMVEFFEILCHKTFGWFKSYQKFVLLQEISRKGNKKWIRFEKCHRKNWEFLCNLLYKGRCFLQIFRLEVFLKRGMWCAHFQHFELSVMVVMVCLWSTMEHSSLIAHPPLPPFILTRIKKAGNFGKYQGSLAIKYPSSLPQIWGAL